MRMSAGGLSCRQLRTVFHRLGLPSLGISFESTPLIHYSTPTMTQSAITPAQARRARRRAGWQVVVADSFAEAESETRAYWRAATPAERLNALESLREPFYGKDQIGGRLQRFLEVVPAE